MRELNRCEVFHEIGHAIAGLIFQGYLMEVKKIILNKEDIKNLKLNINDLAYTHQSPVIVSQEIVDENEDLYAAVNGLNFLAGIAGATYFCPAVKPEKIEITRNNFNKILNTSGSSGDFEYINGKTIMYSWYLFIRNKHNEESAYEVHAYLMNILQSVFLDDEIRDVANNIYNFIIQYPNSNIELEKLNELFPEKLKTEFKEKIIEMINQE